MSVKWKQLGDSRLREIVFEAVQSSQSMREAAIKTGMHYATFGRYAKKFGLWQSNQSGRGMTKEYPGRRIPLDEILAGKYPTYATHNLHRRLITEGLKEKKCEECEITDWNDKRLGFQLDHVNGISSDHRLENLRILCPNCHSQTPTWGNKNRT